MDPEIALVEKEYAEKTKVKNLNTIIIGKYQLECWYYSPYPEEVSLFGLVSTMSACRVSCAIMTDGTRCVHIVLRGQATDSVRVLLQVHEADAYAAGARENVHHASPARK